MAMAWPDSPAYDSLQPQFDPPAPAPPASKFDPAVERWRPLVGKYFQPDQVDKALYVIAHESGGNASIMNTDAATNGASPGLFQITAANAKAAGIDGTDPEQAVKWAATQVANHGWSDWGEGTSYKGQNFGALGQANPYGPGGTGNGQFGGAPGTNFGIPFSQRATDATASAAVLPPSSYDTISAALSPSRTDAGYPTPDLQASKGDPGFSMNMPDRSNDMGMSVSMGDPNKDPGIYGDPRMFQAQAGPPNAAVMKTLGEISARQTADSAGSVLGSAIGSMAAAPYGLRDDGTPKGNGYFGALKRSDGDISTELSVGVNIDGKEVDVPTLVPTLTATEKNWLLTHDVSNPQDIPAAIVQKASDFAQQRIKAGKSPFADASESPSAAMPRQTADIDVRQRLAGAVTQLVGGSVSAAGRGAGSAAQTYQPDDANYSAGSARLGVQAPEDQSLRAGSTLRQQLQQGRYNAGVSAVGPRPGAVLPAAGLIAAGASGLSFGPDLLPETGAQLAGSGLVGNIARFGGAALKGAITQQGAQTGLQVIPGYDKQPLWQQELEANALATQGGLAKRALVSGLATAGMEGAAYANKASGLNAPDIVARMVGGGIGGAVGESPALGRIADASIPHTTVGEATYGAGGALSGGNNLERQVAEQAARDAAASDAPKDVGEQAARDAAPIAEATGRAPLADLGDQGIKDALAAKKEATLTPGKVFGDEGSIQRKVAGAINPSVDMPEDVHVANQARSGVQASLRTELAQEEIPAYRALAKAFDEEKPNYVGPAGRPNASTWIDYAENPSLYDASPNLAAAKDNLKAVQEGVINRVRSDYNVDVKPFQGADPEAAYVPHMESKEQADQGIARTEQSLTSRSSVVKERAYDSLSDRMARQPDFKPEMDPATLADAHSGALSRIAANNTFKTGAGGKTLTEVIDELHPGLVKQRDYLAQRVQAVKAKIDLAEQRLGEHGAAADVLTRERAAIDARAVPKFVAVSEADQLTPEMKTLQTQLGELRIRANSIDRASQKVGGRQLAASLRMRDAQDELSTLEPALADLRTRYHTAATGDYTLNRNTFKYHDPRTSAAIDSVLKQGVNNAFIEHAISTGNAARAFAMGPDLSPLTIQGGLGFFSHPEVAITDGARMAKAAFQTPEEFGKALDSELVRRFEFATNRRLGSQIEEVVGNRGFALPGQPIKKFNDALQRVVDYGTIKAFEHDSAILQKMGHETQNIADHEAANALGKLIPHMNNAETGRSVQRVKMEGLLPTSRSFIAAPVELAKDYTSAVAKAATGQELLGREKLALIRGTTMIGTMFSASVASALLSAQANGKNPVEAVKEVTDPSSSRFMSIIVGNQGSIPIGGPFRRAFLGVYRTSTEGPKGAIQYGRNSLQPEVGAAYDIGTNRDWKGDPIRTGSQWNQIQQSIQHIAESANISAGGAIQGYTEGGTKGAEEQLITGLAGVNFTERSPTEEAMQSLFPGKDFNNLTATEQAQVRDRVKQDARYQGPSDAKQSFDRETKKYDAQDADAVSHWKAGTLDKPLPDKWGDIGTARRAASEAVQADFAKSLPGVPTSRVSSITQGYYGDNLTVKDPTTGAIDWDATFAKRQDYVNGLSTKNVGGHSDREIMDDWLTKVEGAKTPEHQEYDKYIAAKKAAGYFEPGADQKKLDAAHPDIDVQNWKWRGGVVPGADGTDHTPALNSASAVDEALNMHLPNRPVKFAGLVRPINQDANSEAAWKYSQKPIEWYDHGLIDQNWKAEAQRLSTETKDPGYDKPLEQMDTAHRSRIVGNLHETAQKSSPELDAWLYWWGASKTLQTQQASDMVSEIFKKYGHKPPK